MKVNMVKSSNIFAVSYSRKSRTMTVVFRSGLSVYNYFDVSQNVYIKILKAEHPGIILNEIVKGKYKYVRVPNE
jgi:hypothetical protein